VKTPLSFFFRVVGSVVLITLVALWLCDPKQRLFIFLVGVSVCVLLALGVGIFAWILPKHLVYGETGHRAEFRLSMGTDEHELEAGAVAHLPGTTNPKSLPVASGSTTLPSQG